MSNTGVTLDGNKVLNQFIDNPLEIGGFIILIFILLLIGIWIYVKFIKNNAGNSTGDIKNNSGPVRVGNDNY